jgi:hypothetical protein
LVIVLGNFPRYSRCREMLRIGSSICFYFIF